MSKFRVKLTGSDGLVYVDKSVFAPSKFAAVLKATNDIPRTINFAAKQTAGEPLIAKAIQVKNK